MFLYKSGTKTKKLYAKMIKKYGLKMSDDGHLNFTIEGKTVSFTAWHVAEIVSAQKFL